MFLLSGRNVHELYAMAGTLLRAVGVAEPTRNGPALVAPRPVTSHYWRPQERVLFDAQRDANPFFHFFESLWIIAGRADVKWLAQFNSKITNYSDNGQTFHGAYGHRLRFWPTYTPEGVETTFDQIERAIEQLSLNPNDRRVVLSIWDADRDLGKDSKDIPCNDMIKLEIVSGERSQSGYPELNMVVFNRSNDIIWGCYGANAVHFSMLQEYIAGRLVVKVGWMEQVSTNWHAYTDVWEAKEPWAVDMEDSAYHHDEVQPYPMFSEGDHYGHNGTKSFFDTALENFIAWTERLELCVDGTVNQKPDMDPPDDRLNSGFFNHVAVPMYLAWRLWKLNLVDEAWQYVGEIGASDWQLACGQWMDRRLAARAAAEKEMAQ